MFAVTHGYPYEGTDVIAVCDELAIAKDIAQKEAAKLNKYSMDTIRVVSFAINRFYELGVTYDDTNGNRTWFER